MESLSSHNKTFGKNDLEPERRMPARVAIVFLTHIPNERQVSFYRNLSRSGYDVFVSIDLDTYVWQDKEVKAIKIDSDVCTQNGFANACGTLNERLGRACTSWEKAFYYFSMINVTYDFVWFIEADVFIPSVKTLPQLDDKYGDADIISRQNAINTTGEKASWVWFNFIPEELLPPPWAHSIVSAARFSNRLLRMAGSFALRNKDFKVDIHDPERKYPLFVEYLFHTIALQNNYYVIAAPEMANILTDMDWSIEDLRTDYLFHPLKQEDAHNLFRIISRFLDKRRNKAGFEKNALASLVAFHGAMVAARVGLANRLQQMTIELKRLNEELNRLVIERHQLAVEVAKYKVENEELNRLVIERYRTDTELAQCKLERDYWKLSRDKLTAEPSKLVRYLIDCQIFPFSQFAESLEMKKLMRTDFDEEFYLNAYPDVQRNGINSILHYIRHGRREGRQIRLGGMNVHEARPPGESNEPKS